MTAPPQIEPTQPLIEELTPLPSLPSLLDHFADLPHLLLLDSVSGPPELARYSFLSAAPFGWLEARGRHVQWHLAGQAALAEEADPFAVLARLLALYPAATVAGAPPFQGGAAGVFGYELSQHLERLPRVRHDEFAVPELALGFYDWVLAIDHAQQRAWLCATGWPEPQPRERQRAAAQRLAWVRARLAQRAAPSVRAEKAWPLLALQAPGDATLHTTPHRGVWSNFDRTGFLHNVQRAIDYIHAGDCFQVNVAQRLLAPATLPALELYRRLRERNPAPFAGYFDMGAFAVVSASPERFVQLRHSVIETRPIKGTRPRSLDPAEDAARARELLHSAKDRAENVMIVDLLRNDLGRVCQYGSLAVTDVCKLESYQYVHHLVSAVQGRLRPGLTGVDLLRATFPGGSVTGAPKIRAMEIITELEQVARGPYCGCLGYLGCDGSVDLNILIRTFTVGKGWLQFPVGGGIVADSQPEQEYAETWHKAEGLLRALR